MIDVHQEYCPQNHNCPVVGVCPYGAISQDGPFSPPVIDEELCTECGECTNYCPVFRQERQPTF